MSRRPLTRGQQPQKTRKVRRRQLGTSWTAMGMVGAACVAGIAGARYLGEQFLTTGYLKLLILFLCAILLFQNFGLIRSWGRALLDRVRL